MMLAATLLVAVAAPVASAKPAPPTGVHIDPGSPVAKEYAIPLASARGGGGSGNGRLFGSGITRAPSAAAATAASPASTSPASTSAASTPAPGPAATARTPVTPGHGRAHRSRRTRRQRAAQVTAEPVAELSGPGRAAGSGTGIAWMLGVAALVLAVGGTGGAVLARYGRRTSARTS
jgi:hypothetical protein